MAAEIPIRQKTLENQTSHPRVEFKIEPTTEDVIPDLLTEKTLLRGRRQSSYTTTDSQLLIAPSREFTLGKEIIVSEIPDPNIDKSGRKIGGWAFVFPLPPGAENWIPNAIKWAKDHTPIFAVISGVGSIIGAGAKIADVIIKGRRDEEKRYQRIVEGLQSSKVNAQADAATELLTFLHNAKRKEYPQAIFRLAVNHFRERQVDPENPQFNAADKAFVLVFIEAASRIREKLEKEGGEITHDVSETLLDASGVHLDGADFQVNTNLSHIYLYGATFVNANLRGINFSEAFLSNANLFGATLFKANLSGADLNRADMREANLIEADIRANLSSARLDRARLIGANLSMANLGKAQLEGALLTNANLKNTYLINADLNYTVLTDADFSGAILSLAELIGANLEDASSLEKTNLYKVQGLNLKQLQLCVEKGASFDHPGKEI